MDIIQRRKALADALSAHDPEAVKSFLHPSLVVRGTDGAAVIDSRELLRRLPTFFSNHPEYKQSVEIQTSQVEGDVAALATKRSERLDVLWWPQTVISRWNETWKRVGGEWMLVEERPEPS